MESNSPRWEGKVWFVPARAYQIARTTACSLLFSSYFTRFRCCCCCCCCIMATVRLFFFFFLPTITAPDPIGPRRQLTQLLSYSKYLTDECWGCGMVHGDTLTGAWRAVTHTMYSYLGRGTPTGWDIHWKRVWSGGFSLLSSTICNCRIIERYYAFVFRCPWNSMHASISNLRITFVFWPFPWPIKPPKKSMAQAVLFIALFTWAYDILVFTSADPVVHK